MICQPGAPLSLLKQREFRTGLDADLRLLRRLQAVYYGMISRVDEQMGRIIRCPSRGIVGADADRVVVGSR